MTTTTAPPVRRERASRPRWWRRPWVAPLAVVAIAFVAFSLPPYVSLDPAQSRVPPPYPWYYAVLSVHVVLGSIAMLACCLQVWPWFRQRHRRAHRVVGRVYVLIQLPAGVLALVLAWVTPFGPVAMASSLLMAPLWMACTITGWRMARQRRFAEHRRWMVRSFALTMSIITNRIWGVVAMVLLAPSTPAGGEQQLMQTVAGLSTWLGWTIPLLVAEWWLQRGDVARDRARVRAR
ncbi:DUF2306 domain-containing protein [Nonomuraea sp. NPDC049152]|uniref:DUF2306 domain-containing protein n=1 Tax=Nonomuraea sp. NPDC049152 TaxID=3154350 RepID=UPI0033C1E8DC